MFFYIRLIVNYTWVNKNILSLFLSIKRNHVYEYSYKSSLKGLTANTNVHHVIKKGAVTFEKRKMYVNTHSGKLDLMLLK